MDPKRRLKIKTGSCRRLAQDLHMYRQEKEELDVKTNELRKAKKDMHSMKKHREFVEETEAALQDTHMRAQEAYEELVELVKELGEHEEVKGTKLLSDANAIIASCSEVFSSPGAEQKLEEAVRVCLFGGSQVKEGSDTWNLAERLGKKLAEAGIHLISGGYSGIMEAASKGAREVEGSAVEGVICPSAFPMHGNHGNKYLTKETKTPDLHERVKTITKSAQAYVVLPGGVGTLVELTTVWNLSLVNQFSKQPRVPLYCFRQPWEALLSTVGESLGLSDKIMDHVTYVDEDDAALDTLVAQLKEGSRA